jgi:hypothetical protein
MTGKNTPQIIPSFIRQLRNQNRLPLHALVAAVIAQLKKNARFFVDLAHRN